MPDAPDKDLSIQNDFFNLARKSRTRVTIFLASGKRLVGRIKAFDRFTIILDAGNGADEMIFKHAIATVSTSTRPAYADSRGGDVRSSRPDPAHVQGAPAAVSTSSAAAPASEEK